MANMKLELNYVPESVLRSRQRRREAGRFSYFHMLVILLLFVMAEVAADPTFGLA